MDDERGVGVSERGAAEDAAGAPVTPTDVAASRRPPSRTAEAADGGTAEPPGAAPTAPAADDPAPGDGAPGDPVPGDAGPAAGRAGYDPAGASGDTDAYRPD